MKPKVLIKSLSGFLFLLFLITPALSQPSQTAKVLKIVDGDTLEIHIHGIQEKLRLIGIDCPEGKKNAKAKKDSQRTGKDIEVITEAGKRATAFSKRLVRKGDMVRVEFDVQQRDKYHRLLGYVFLTDGRMLNEEIVRAGYASLMTYPPNVKYLERFSKAYRDARENKRGLWK